MKPIECINCGLLRSTCEMENGDEWVKNCQKIEGKKHEFNEELCEPCDLLFLSNPPQSKCKNCGQYWFTKDFPPKCRKLVCKRDGSIKPQEKTEIAKNANEDEVYCKICRGCGEVGCDGIKSFLEKHVRGKTDCLYEDSFINDIEEFYNRL